MTRLPHTIVTLATTLLAVAILSTAPPAVGEPSRPAPASGSWPLQPRPDVVRGFDPPEAQWSAGHRGVDLAGSPGQVVHASLAGEVGFVGSIGGKPVVTVVHGGRRTTYEPVVALVSRGEAVRQGQPLGRLVTAAGHCFPATCLHWGLLRGDTYLDPLSLVGGGPVRLLPLWRHSPEGPTCGPDALVPLLTPWRSPLDLFLAARQVKHAGGPDDRPGAADRW